MRHLLTLLLVLFPGWAAGDVFEVGQPAPALVLPTLTDGAPGALSQYRGGKVLLLVYASW
jgi:hypothetical protein